jgi:hypothetical protein
MRWEILDANYRRWGSETFPTKEEAERELKQFWKGVAGVNLKKFSIREVILNDQPADH